MRHWYERCGMQPVCRFTVLSGSHRFTIQMTNNGSAHLSCLLSHGSDLQLQLKVWAARIGPGGHTYLLIQRGSWASGDVHLVAQDDKIGFTTKVQRSWWPRAPATALLAANCACCCKRFLQVHISLSGHTASFVFIAANLCPEHHHDYQGFPPGVPKHLNQSAWVM